ncbi:ran GTPase-activating protein 1 [Leptidea sinapis]|uniref:ran GTPase-activating protein 1 n=1 Tax=Leptidea sinapis TaxID=189913 RepID=UPI0021327B1D|nr:ran GTPase-activating protein 1 [Leptidea sinapis]
MFSFDLSSISTALLHPGRQASGVDFSGKSLKLNTEDDAKPIVDAINACPDLQYLTLTGNTLGIPAAKAIAKALENHPELKSARFSDMFTGRMKTEIPPALAALGDGMIQAGARLSELDLSDNAFGPIGVEGLAKLLQSEVCSELQELRLNNNGLGITGGKLLAKALSASPKKLKVFIAGRNRLENDGAKALAVVFQNMGTLEEIAMPQNGIYHVGISALSDAFQVNPRLTCLNLNDNTIGPKGAAAIARALPKLKQLKSINFGDCLLKSAGAIALAKGLKDSSMPLQSLDLSHNEIGKDACMEVVDAISSSPDSKDRLTRVTLAGNSLGGAANKKVMKDKLGAAAELSDDEGSDDEDEYVSDSEEPSEGSDDDGSSEDSATEDAQHMDTVLDISDMLKTSDAHAVESNVGEFLLKPTIQNLEKLGSDGAVLIDTHLQAIKKPENLIQAYVEATCCVSGLSDQSPVAAVVARQLYPLMVQRASLQWLLTNELLKALQLIKSEDKAYRVRWYIPACYKVLASQIEEAYFPAPIRETLKFFISTKLPVLEADVKSVVEGYRNLYT